MKTCTCGNIKTCDDNTCLSLAAEANSPKLPQGPLKEIVIEDWAIYERDEMQKLWDIQSLGGKLCVALDIGSPSKISSSIPVPEAFVCKGCGGLSALKCYGWILNQKLSNGWASDHDIILAKSLIELNATPEMRFLGEPLK